MPRVTVVIPVYNASQFVRETLESFRHQTFTDFEVIAVNDGSTDGTAEVLESFSAPWYSCLHLPSNQGVAAALNAGLERVSGEFFARADADDIQLPTRLHHQVAYFDRHPKVVLTGMQMELFGAETGHWPFPQRDEEIRALLPFTTSMAQPTIMARQEAAQKINFRYPPVRYGEDYDMIWQFYSSGQLASLPEVGVRYRRTQNSLSRGDEEYKLKRFEPHHRKALERVGFPSPDEGTLRAHYQLYFNRSLTEPVPAYIQHARALVDVNQKTGVIPVQAFRNEVFKQVVRLAHRLLELRRYADLELVTEAYPELKSTFKWLILKQRIKRLVFAKT